MTETPTAADVRDQLVSRLWQVVELSWRLNSDDLPCDVEPISDPERDVWSAAALLHSALHRHGIAVRDEYWDLLAAAPVVAAELRRIADLDPSWTICGPATFLRARADELDPPTRED